MPKKTETPKAKNNFDIKGGIHARRDVIMGDQQNIINQTSQTLNITSPQEFVAELQKLRAEIAQLKQLPSLEPIVIRRLTNIDGDIEEAMIEAEKDQPIPERIKTTLDSAKEMMEKLGGSITSAVNLGTLLGNLALMAWKVFGG
jgi:hypothetical protein